MAQGIFPRVSVDDVAKETEFNRWTLMQFINSTRLVTTATKQDLTALRLVSMQNRLILDQLTAASGGVCAVIGTTCCTYIPDNDADSNIIFQGIQNMSRLAHTLQSRQVQDADWFSSFFTGYKCVLMQLFTTVMLIIVLFMILSCFVIPCIKGLVHSMLKAVVGQYVSLPDAHFTDLFPSPDWIPPYQDCDADDVL